MKVHQISFKKKIGLTLMSIIPHKAIVTKTKGQLKDGEIQKHTDEWNAFLKEFMHKNTVTVTISWVTDEEKE